MLPAPREAWCRRRLPSTLMVVLRQAMIAAVTAAALNGCGGSSTPSPQLQRMQADPMSHWQPSGLLLDDERVEDTDLDGGLLGKPSQAMIYRVWTGSAAALEREQARAFSAARSAGWMLRPWGSDAMRAVRSGVALTIDIDGPRLSVSLAEQ